MQTDSTAGLPPQAVNEIHRAPAPRSFGWRDIFVSLIVLPVTILAIAIPILYLSMDTPQKNEISASEYRFIVKLYEAKPSTRPAIKQAMADRKITRKEFDQILDMIDIKPSHPTLSRPQAQLKQI